MNEKCDNCDRKFGHLETPGIWEGHAVCADCYQLLKRQAAPATSAPPESIIFDRERIVITNRTVAGNGLRIPLEYILSVSSDRLLFRSSIGVHISDVIQRTHRFVFRKPENAKDFVVALRRANPSVTIMQEQWSFFLWW